MDIGSALNQYLAPVQDIFPKDNPYGTAIENFVLGDSVERTQRMAEGYPHQYTGAGPNDPAINPAIMDLISALPIGTALKAAATAGAAAKGAGQFAGAVGAVQKGARHPVGGSNVLAKPLDEMSMEFTVDDSPIAQLREAQNIKPEDLLGKALIPALGDRSDIGKHVTKIGEHELAVPETLYGGPKYMLQNIDPRNNSVWASDKGRVSALNNQAKNALAQGYDPALIYTPMSHDTMAFNTMMLDATIQQMATSKISKKAMRAFDKQVKAKRPEWGGLGDPVSVAMLRENGALRTAFLETAAKKEFLKQGFPDAAETRWALTDKDFLEDKIGYGGRHIARITGENIGKPDLLHPTYSHQMEGEYLGGLEQPIPPQVMYPEWNAQRRHEQKNPNKDYRSLTLKQPMQIADEEWLKGVNNYLGTNTHAPAGPKQYGDIPLPGAPMPANVPGLGKVNIGPNPAMEQAAIAHSEATGIPYTPVKEFKPVDPAFGAQVAREYDLMAHDPSDPFVRESYEQLNKEVKGQYEQMLAAGIKPEFSNNPYPDSPYQALEDMLTNKKLEVYPTKDGFGSSADFDPAGNPLLAESGYEISGQPALYNDLFRAVHDAQGHGKIGAGFRAGGEEMAYQSHVGTLSPLAQRALATETRGQNSWLNFGPHGETNRAAGIDATIFADQKTGNLPNWVTQQGTPAFEARKKQFSELHKAGESGLEGAIDGQGNLILVHYSKSDIDRVEPKEYGKGLSGQTRDERNRRGDKRFPKRSYYGIEADENPYRKESSLGDNKVETRIQAAQVYDANTDPDGLWAAAKGDVTGAEKAIYDAGYSGYRVDNKSLGKVAAIFDPLDVTKKLMIPIGVVGAGTYNALSNDKAANDAL
jgi:hypothetical protein